MMTMAVPNAEMIALARECRSFAQSELAPKVAMTQARLSRIEAGLYPATPEDVRHLSRVLRFPESFFYQNERRFGVGVSEFYHRKRAKLAARALDAIHARIELIRLHVARLLKSADLHPAFELKPIDLEGMEQTPEDAARAIRATLILPRGPVESVVACLENFGGIVVRVDFDTRLLDAVSRWIPGMPPLFIVNRSIPPDRERFTLAHELGHLVMHDAPHPEMEKEAHRFASEFLMPADDIRASLYDLTLPKLASLKRYWKVSMAALARRGFDLGTINERRYRSLNVQLSKSGFKMREPMELDPPREDTSLMEGLIGFHMRDLSFQVEELAAYLHVGVPDLLSTYQINAPFHPGSPKAKLRAV